MILLQVLSCCRDKVFRLGDALFHIFHGFYGAIRISHNFLAIDHGQED